MAHVFVAHGAWAEVARLLVRLGIASGEPDA
jgi:hypothetical protein